MNLLGMRRTCEMTITDDTTVESERPLSPKQFCEAENISLSTYHKLKRMGLGPNEWICP